VRHPPAAQVIEHGDVLGQPDGVVQRGQQRGNRDRYPGRDGGEGGRDQQRSGQVAVVDTVVLGQDERIEAGGVTVGGLGDRGRVRAFARGRADRRAA
jgi:hypothetical protein